MHREWLRLLAGAWTGVALVLALVGGATRAEEADGDAEAVAAAVVDPLADVVVPPGAEALAAAALAGRSDATGEAIAVFYAARGFAPLWLAPSGGPAPQARALVAALRAASDHALPASRYAPDGIEAGLAAGHAPTTAEGAALELGLARSFLAYARDMSSGVLEPRRVDAELHVFPERPDPSALLGRIAGAAEPERMLAGLAPQHPDYNRLRARLAGYRAIAGSGAWAEALPGGPTLREGDRSDRVVALRERLFAMGLLEAEARGVAGAAASVLVAENDPAPGTASDLPRRQPADPRLFDGEVRAAVERFQERHGLNRDGVVGPATRAALNEDPRDRARQIAVNLERLRWLNRDLGRRHVMVNLAGFEMAVIEDGAPVFTSRVVVGKSPRHRTPEFSDEMDHMVVNPTWHVPASIAREEILPLLRADPGYLSRKNMTLIGADPDTIDWNAVTPRSFPGRIRQAPGSGNALGRVKFMFPNQFSIYLHDTPQKSLFSRDTRAFSHGCVRVQKPMEFARLLLAAQRDDAEAYFDRLLRSGREAYVPLEEHLPVHLTYRTAWVDETGTDQFRGDVYGRDAKVYAALAAAGLDLFAD